MLSSLLLLLLLPLLLTAAIFLLAGRGRGSAPSAEMLCVCQIRMLYYYYSTRNSLGHFQSPSHKHGLGLSLVRQAKETCGASIKSNDRF
jgi:hypothetical protein